MIMKVGLIFHTWDVLLHDETQTTGHWRIAPVRDRNAPDSGHAQAGVGKCHKLRSDLPALRTCGSWQQRRSRAEWRGERIRQWPERFAASRPIHLLDMSSCQNSREHSNCDNRNDAMRACFVKLSNGASCARLQHSSHHSLLLRSSCLILCNLQTHSNATRMAYLIAMCAFAILKQNLIWRNSQS